MADGVPVRLAVLVSGNGTNLQAVIDRIEAREINARIACVVSNRQDAFALKRAEQHGIPTIIRIVLLVLYWLSCMQQVGSQDNKAMPRCRAR